MGQSLQNNIDHLKELVPHDAYFGGRMNAAVLYYTYIGIEHGY